MSISTAALIVAIEATIVLVAANRTESPKLRANIVVVTMGVGAAVYATVAYAVISGNDTSPSRPIPGDVWLPLLFALVHTLAFWLIMRQHDKLYGNTPSS